MSALAPRACRCSSTPSTAARKQYVTSCGPPLFALTEGTLILIWSRRLPAHAGDLVVQVLDEERRTGQILTARSSRYRFQHDNWIDVLISSCPRVRLRALHAACFALLRADRAADPKKLIRHAIEAGTTDMARQELAALASQAADQEVANYAFSSAAQLYEVAAGYAAGEEQVGLLIKQSGALRLCGGGRRRGTCSGRRSSWRGSECQSVKPSPWCTCST